MSNLQNQPAKLQNSTEMVSLSCPHLYKNNTSGPLGTDRLCK